MIKSGFGLMLGAGALAAGLLAGCNEAVEPPQTPVTDSSGSQPETSAMRRYIESQGLEAVPLGYTEKPFFECLDPITYSNGVVSCLAKPYTKFQTEDSGLNIDVAEFEVRGMGKRAFHVVSKFRVKDGFSCVRLQDVKVESLNSPSGGGSLPDNSMKLVTMEGNDGESHGICSIAVRNSENGELYNWSFRFDGEPNSVDRIPFRLLADSEALAAGVRTPGAAPADRPSLPPPPR